MADTPIPQPGSRKPAAGPGRSRNRAPGRPVADSPDLRERLLDAALACFVRQGIAATSLRDIARRAGVTPALLHYYFGDRPQLQEAVVQERAMPVFQLVRDRMLQGDGMADLVAGFVGGVTEAVKRYPWWP